MLPGKAVDVPDDSIINSGILCRLASGFLFDYLTNKVREINAFERFALPEMIDIVLSWLGLKDRKRYC